MLHVYSARSTSLKVIVILCVMLRAIESLIREIVGKGQCYLSSLIILEKIMQVHDCICTVHVVRSLNC